MGGSIDGCLVTTGSIGEAARDTADGGYADTAEVMNFAIGEVFLQISDDLPPIHERLQLGGCAQIREEIATFSDTLQSHYCLEERVFGARLLAFGFVSVRFHHMY